MMIYFKLNNEVTFCSPIKNVQIDAIKFVKIKNVGNGGNGKRREPNISHFSFGSLKKESATPIV
jgi:hypothetical protein